MSIEARMIERARAVRLEDEIVRRGIKLKGGIERAGPCPNCGGNDRFSINTQKQIFNCRGCEAKGDVIELTQFLDRCTFIAAVEMLSGERTTKERSAGLGPIKATYDYVDESGALLFQSLRFEPPGQPKVFRQRTGPNQDKWSIKGVRIVPYRLPELIEDIALDHTVFIVEGEKDVLTLRALGIPATCNPMGAGKWREDFKEIFRGAEVVVCGDNDKPGRDHVDIVAHSLRGVAKRVRILDLAKFWPAIQDKDDISDWIGRGRGTVERLCEIVDELPDWEPKLNGEHRPSDSDENYHNRRDETWPSPRFRTLKDFCAEYQPIAEVVGGGALYSGSLYTLTARTGTGKTSWLVTTALAGISGLGILGRPVKRGRYAFCTAENPDGVRMRFAVGSFHWNIDQDAVGRDLVISDNRVRPEEICEYLAREAEHGPFTGIFIDTWQAFFDGRDANNPTEAVNFTKRFRPLVALPGAPAVVIAAHPNKNANNDELIPNGGGSTLNEVDGNLAMAQLPSGLVELGWQGKFRGLNFEPQLYRIDRLCSPDVVDVTGRQIAIPLMLPISVEDADARESAIANMDTRLLRSVAENPSGTLSTLADAAGVSRSKADRTFHRLAKAKPALIHQTLGKWMLTKPGIEALKRCSESETEPPSVSP
jgi:hypothetical protein